MPTASPGATSSSTPSSTRTGPEAACKVRPSPRTCTRGSRSPEGRRLSIMRRYGLLYGMAKGAPAVLLAVLLWAASRQRRRAEETPGVRRLARRRLRPAARPGFRIATGRRSARGRPPRADPGWRRPPANTTAGGRARIDWALADTPDAAIVELGGNDGLRGIDPAAMEANLAAILDTLATHHIPVPARRHARPAKSGRRLRHPVPHRLRAPGQAPRPDLRSVLPRRASPATPP